MGVSSLSLQFLGTGASSGVPIPLCLCAVCNGQDPKNQRTRSSLALQTPHISFLIDPSPEFRLQSLKQQLDHLDAVFLTHYHYDHVAGIDDLKPFAYQKKQKLPIYTKAPFASLLKNNHPYLFSGNPVYAHLHLNILEEEQQVLFKDCIVQEIPIFHGKLPISGFKVGKIAYLTDCSWIPPQSLKFLKDLDILILGMLHQEKDHPQHMNLKQVLYYQKVLAPKQIFLTHLSHTIDYHLVNTYLRETLHIPNVQCAYDGMKIAL